MAQPAAKHCYDDPQKTPHLRPRFDRLWNRLRSQVLRAKAAMRPGTLARVYKWVPFRENFETSPYQLLESGELVLVIDVTATDLYVLTGFGTGWVWTSYVDEIAP